MESPIGVPDSWRSSLLLALGVLATVLMALLLAVSDSLQMRLPPPQPTQIAAAGATDTPIPPTISLPSATPTRPASTPTATSEKRPSATAVPVLPKCGVVPAEWVAYTIKRGDTLFRLAMSSGATVSSIMVANCLDSTRIYAGMTVYLPAEPPPPPPICTGPPPSWVRYRVQRGDTLYSLARARNTTVYAVVSANCLVGTRINAEQIIYLPAAEATPRPTATQPPPPPPTEPPPPPPSATPQPSATATAAPPTPTSTATAVPPTPTDTAVPPTPTPTSPPPSETPTPTPSPSATATAGTATPTATSTVTATATAAPDTPTPTNTATAQSPTATATSTPTPMPPTPTSTVTASATSTPTPEPPTATFTPEP